MSGAGTLLRLGTVTDPRGDAPAGLDLRALHASYSPTRGALATTVTMHGGLSRSAVIIVAFGTRGATDDCELASGEQVVFGAGSEAAAWYALDASGIPALSP